MKRILTIVLTAAIAIESSFSVQAAVDVSEAPNLSAMSASEVFNEKDVQRLLENARKQPVYEIVGDDEEEDDNDVFSPQSDRLQISPRKLASSGEEEAGKYTKRKGTILVTSDAYKNLIPTGHAGIVRNSNNVIEAVSSGVRTDGSMNWKKTKNEMWEVKVNGTTRIQRRKVANWCAEQEGKPYNYLYPCMWRRDAFYCSHLVWAGYKDKLGIDLNTFFFDTKYGTAIHPVELVWTDKTTTIYYHKK